MEQIALWNVAFPKEKPSGDDVSFDPEFEALKTEVEKENSLYADGEPDWSKVLDLVTGILNTKSKDLWVFCYGCRAAYSKGGLKACAAAISSTNFALSFLWDSIYPQGKRITRRAAPFVWLAGKFNGLFVQNEFPYTSPEDSDLFRSAIKKLQETLDEHFGDSAPSFSTILRAIPDAFNDKSLESGAPPTSALLQKTQTNGILSADYLPKLFRSVQDETQQLAAHYLNLDMTDYRVYLLHRAALWGVIGQMPPYDENRVTQLRPLPRDKMLSYGSAVDSGQYQAILPQLERSVSRQAFWFDGHHLVARCLEALGAKSALEVVCYTVRQFLERYPDLKHCKFYDGTPFASISAQNWLSELSSESVGRAMPPRNVDALEGEGDADQLTMLEQALNLAKQNGFKAGMEFFESVPLGRSRASMELVIAKAEYCIAMGKDKSAAYILHGIYSRLQTWGLLEWEPELSAKVLSLLYSTRKGKSMENKEEILETLYWLHFDTAMDIARE